MTFCRPQLLQNVTLRNQKRWLAAPTSFCSYILVPLFSLSLSFARPCSLAFSLSSGSIASPRPISGWRSWRIWSSASRTSCCWTRWPWSSSWRTWSSGKEDEDSSLWSVMRKWSVAPLKRGFKNVPSPVFWQVDGCTELVQSGFRLAGRRQISRTKPETLRYDLSAWIDEMQLFVTKYLELLMKKSNQMYTTN